MRGQFNMNQFTWINQTVWYQIQVIDKSSGLTEEFIVREDSLGQTNESDFLAQHISEKEHFRVNFPTLWVKKGPLGWLIN